MWERAGYICRYMNFRLLVLGLILPLVASLHGQVQISYRYFQDTGRVADSSMGYTYFYKVVADSQKPERGQVFHYLENGKLQATWHFSGLKKLSREGISFWYSTNGNILRKAIYTEGDQDGYDSGWYAGGALKYVCWYEAGKLEGRLKKWDSTGRLIRNQDYENDVAVSGACFGESSAEMPCVPWHAEAEFKGGWDAFSAWVSEHFKISKAMRKTLTEGDAQVRFVVFPDGSLGGFKVAYANSSLVSDEVIRLLKKCPAWIPAYQFGEPVASYYIVPVKLQFE